MEETFTQEQSEEDYPAQLALTARAQEFLKETAKWARFLGILGFVLCGFLLLCAVFGSSITTYSQRFNPQPYYSVTQSASIKSLLYIVVAAIHFFPALYAYRFGTRMQRSLMFGDEDGLTESFADLRSLYKFWGILAIVYLCLVSLIMIGVLIITAFVTIRR